MENIPRSLPPQARTLDGDSKVGREHTVWDWMGLLLAAAIVGTAVGASAQLQDDKEPCSNPRPTEIEVQRDGSTWATCRAANAEKNCWDCGGYRVPPVRICQTDFDTSRQLLALVLQGISNQKIQVDKSCNK